MPFEFGWISQTPRALPAKPDEGEHAAEVGTVDCDIRVPTHDRLRAERDAERRPVEHQQVVRTVADGDGAGQGDSGVRGPLLERCGLRRRVDDGPIDAPGEPAAVDLEAVRAAEVESEAFGERVEELVEAARDDADEPAGRVHAVDELAYAVGWSHPLACAREHPHIESLERRDPLAEARREVELAAHRAFGDRGDVLEAPGGLGEQLDGLFPNQRGVGIEHDEQAASSAAGGRTAHAAARTREPLPTTVMPLSVTMKPRATSSARSTPMRAPASTTTSLSRMARCTVAPASMRARSKRIESATCAPEPTIAHGPSTLRSTCAPEMTEPSETIESMTVPRDPRASRVNLAGGEFNCWLKI